MSETVWRCDACGNWREDRWISVAHLRFAYPPLAEPVQLNAKYCNDLPECLRAVADVLERWRSTFKVAR